MSNKHVNQDEIKTIFESLYFKFDDSFSLKIFLDLLDLLLKFSTPEFLSFVNFNSSKFLFYLPFSLCGCVYPF